MMVSVFMEKSIMRQCGFPQCGGLLREPDSSQSMMVIRPYSGKDTLGALNFDQLIINIFYMFNPDLCYFSP